ncbi:MAG TPA: hypothetical protein VFE53_17740 [Mucilaginibacter sp.]|jgi:hypothetical protein|nr:hypothetical protein [Mucilaginibacter sp.]
MVIVRIIAAIFLKQFKQILLTSMLLLLIVPVIAQNKKQVPGAVAHHGPSKKLKEFFQLVRQANVKFEYPNGFREIVAPDNEDFSFDYALELPGKDFEIWFKVSSQKEEWFNYTRTQTTKGPGMENPDSVYLDIGKAMASTLAGDQAYFERSIPGDVLTRYHADAGKSYLLTLLDLPDTRHYKYALLITLQRNHTGTILAICFGNDKGPEFFKNINKASHCLKFKS